MILMLTRPERHALVILCCVILILAGAHIGIQFLTSNEGAVKYTGDTRDGTLVTHTGTIEEIRFTKTGGHLIINLSGTDVFVPNGGTSPTFLRGDEITVFGTVETYAGKKEIVVKSISDITLT